MSEMHLQDGLDTMRESINSSKKPKSLYHTDVECRNELGEICCYFDAGEHIIEISKNVAFNYKTEEIEGYAIKEVEINGWTRNNKITYVNTKPVIVVASKERKGKFEFNNFGIVINEKYKTKIK